MKTTGKKSEENGRRNNMITRPFFLLFAVSLAVLCIFACGCTSQEKSPDTGPATIHDEGFDRGNMTLDEAGKSPGSGNTTTGDENITVWRDNEEILLEQAS